jgi:hypothetical protein
MALSTTGVQAMLERLEIGELVFNLKEVHHKCAPSWNRRRIARKFDGWQLTLPGTLLCNGYATKDEAVAAAQQMVETCHDARHLAVEMNKRAIAAGKTFYD